MSQENLKEVEIITQRIDHPEGVSNGNQIGMASGQGSPTKQQQNQEISAQNHQNQEKKAVEQQQYENEENQQIPDEKNNEQQGVVESNEYNQNNIEQKQLETEQENHQEKLETIVVDNNSNHEEQIKKEQLEKEQQQQAQKQKEEEEDKIKEQKRQEEETKQQQQKLLQQQKEEQEAKQKKENEEQKQNQQQQQQQINGANETTKKHPQIIIPSGVNDSVQSNTPQNKNVQSSQRSPQSNEPAIKINAPSQKSNKDNASQQPQEESKEEKGLFDDDDEDVKKSRFPIIEKLLENNYYQIAITFITMYALFGDDIRVMATTRSADIVFDVFTIFTLAIFSVEIILNILSKPDYIWSFFFWLDFISTISLLLDIQLIANEIFYGGESSSSSVDASQFAAAGKASRVGTKAGRVVRLVRLIRIVKLYKLSQEQVEIQNQQKQKIVMERLKKKQNNPSYRQSRANMLRESNINNINQLQQQQSSQYGNNLSAGQKRGSVQSPTGTKRESVMQVDKGAPPVIYTKESRVSRRLSDLTTKRVIIIVLCLLFIMPLFSSDYYFDPPSSIDFSTYQMKKMSEIGTTQQEIEDLFYNIRDTHREATNDSIVSPLALLTTPFSFVKNFEVSDFDELRNEDQDKYTYALDLDKFKDNHEASMFTINYNDEIEDLEQKDDDKILFFQGTLSTRSTNIITAGLSLGRTIFVCIVLTCGALQFSKDANDLALGPIERLIDIVNKISKNPISAKEQEIVKSDGKDSEMETIIIGNAIVKIGVLLALGFGDAGSEIIGSNMQKSGDVDPMIPGAKKCAIYGFCDIRNFTDATEVLQEEVMLFVNNIGEVVHSMTDRYQGAANKNIGDAFLLVWKIPMEKYNIKDNNEIVFHDQPYISKLSDMSLIAFMKIQVKLNREPKILNYRKDERLQKRMANYKVKLGYGLHIGWGIEGAIGSEFKIDASYLSPNVNMAARLEAATKQFGTPILISSALQEQFTPELKKLVRYIDKVTVKGSNQPIGFYTIDQNIDDLPISKNPEIDYPGQTKQDRFDFERQKKHEVLVYLTEPEEWDWNIHAYIQSNKDLRISMDNRDEAFQDLFASGFEFYLSGDWPKCKSIFQECKKTHPEDGPMLSLWNVMEETNFQAPKDWAGYRVLTEK